MKTTIRRPVAAREVTQDSLLSFVNKELTPLVREMRDVHNHEYTTQITGASIGTGATTVIWTSDAIPTDTAWRVHADVVGSNFVAGARGMLGRVAGFYNDTGTVAQEGATTALWTIRSAAGITASLAASGQTVTLSVTDDSASAMAWLAQIRVLSSRELIP